MGILCPGEVIHQIGQQRARAGEEDVKGFHIRYVLHIVTRVRASFPAKNIENAVKSFPPPVHLSFLWSGLPGSCVQACQNFIKVVIFKGYPYFSFVKGALFFPNSL